MQNNQKIIGTNEILGSLLSSNAKDINALKNDPEAFILSAYNIALPENISLAVVENSNETINLVLPYYPNMEEISAKTLSDLDAAEIAGGEIAGSIVLAIAVTLGFVGVGALGGYLSQKEHIDNK